MDRLLWFGRTLLRYWIHNQNPVKEVQFPTKRERRDQRTGKSEIRKEEDLL